MNTAGHINDDLLLLRPRALQLLIDNLPLLLFATGGFLYADMDGMPFTGLLMWLSAALLPVLAYRLVYLRRMVYRLTGEQLIHEHGVFTRSCDYVELYRVVDFAERSSLLQQICGLKTVSIYSGDRNTPRLDIIGMDAGERLVPLIRTLVEQNKRRKGIYEITNR